MEKDFKRYRGLFMLKSLRIKNCMCHENTNINFHKGMTVFIGKSEHGKSAIFNCLYKVMTNRPLGDEWRSWGGGDSLIELKAEKDVIVYKKGKSTQDKGIYTLNDTDFQAVGTTVPEEITNVLKIDRKVNIQKQLERGVPIFLISESPGDVAKFFNKVSGLYKIDETIDAGKVDLKKTEKGYNLIKEQIEEKELELKKYQNVESLLLKITKAEKLEKEITQKKDLNHFIDGNLTTIEHLKVSIQEKENKLEVKSKINEATKTELKILKISKQTSDIENHLKLIKTKSTKIKKYQKKLKVSPKINKAFSLLKTINQIKSNLSVLDKQFTRLNLIITKTDTIGTALIIVALKFDKLMPGICPLCGENTSYEHNP